MPPVSSFGARLWAEARDDLSLGLLAALVITALLIRAFAPEERTKVRGMTILTALHLVLLPVLASLRGASSDWYNDVRLAALVFETLAFVGMAAALIFGLALPRAGFRAPRILRDVLTAAVAIVSIIIGANNLGFPLSGVITTSAILTAVIGFS